MIIRARTVVTMDRPPSENGAIAVCGNQIVEAGNFHEIKARYAGQVIDLGEQALLPGLINAHCHLDYTCLRGKIPPQKSFADWIHAINAEKAKLLPKDYLISINEGFAEAKRFGTTTIANLTAFPDLIPEIGPPMNDCGKSTPLELFLGALPSTSLRTGSGRALSQCIVAHLNEVTESDFNLLERSERRFHVVHSPRSHDYFKHRRFPFEKLHTLGFNICLGTDSLASNESLSLFDEMRAFRRSEPGISPNKILEMVTVNPATALHQENALGRIRRDLRADLLAVRCNER